jgi:hypothetical protein
MTDMSGTQAVLADEELINLLVPPRRPRWHVALAVAGVAVVVAGILVINRSGVLSPRVKVSVDQISWKNEQASATFLITNDGWTSTEVRGIAEDVDNLHNASVVSVLPRTVAPGKTVSVTVHFDVDCSFSSSNDRTNEIGVKVKNAIGITTTQTHTIDNNAFDNGWAGDLHDNYCAANPPR